MPPNLAAKPGTPQATEVQALTLGRYLSAAPADVPGAVAAFAVDGTPADSVSDEIQRGFFSKVSVTTIDIRQ
jgi:hypothetical protein